MKQPTTFQGPWPGIEKFSMEKLSLDAQPFYQLHLQPIEIEGKLQRVGVWCHHYGVLNNTWSHTWLCAPLQILGIEQFGDHTYRLILKYQSLSGKENTWAMPMGLLARSRTAILRELYSRGLDINYESRYAIVSYLVQEAASARALGSTSEPIEDEPT